MNDVLKRQLALAIDKRLAVYKGCIQDNSILSNTTEKQMAIFMITEILRPCCCMVCNISSLENILQACCIFSGKEQIIKHLANKVYLELARMNGLG